jgi:hypothetical protein
MPTFDLEKPTSPASVTLKLALPVPSKKSLLSCPFQNAPGGSCAGHSASAHSLNGEIFRIRLMLAISVVVNFGLSLLLVWLLVLRSSFTTQ